MHTRIKWEKSRSYTTAIIENYRELIADYDLADTLKSETDSEVVAALLKPVL